MLLVIHEIWDFLCRVGTFFHDSWLPDPGRPRKSPGILPDNLAKEKYMYFLPEEAINRYKLNHNPSSDRHLEDNTNIVRCIHVHTYPLVYSAQTWKSPGIFVGADCWEP